MGRADPGRARQRRPAPRRDRLCRRATVHALLRAVPPAGRGQPEDAHPDAAFPRARRPRHSHRDADCAGHGHVRADRTRSLTPRRDARRQRLGRGAHGRRARPPQGVRRRPRVNNAAAKSSRRREPTGALHTKCRTRTVSTPSRRSSLSWQSIHRHHYYCHRSPSRRSRCRRSC